MRYNIDYVLSMSDDDKKKIVEGKVKHNFDSYDLFIIAESINDDEYKCNVIKNYDNYGFSIYDALELTNSIGSDALKSIVNNYKQYNFDTFLLCEIVKKIDDDDYKKEVVNHYEDYDFNLFNLVSIISSVDDDDYKKEKISESSKYGFVSNDITVIAFYVTDDKYKYDLIKNNTYNLENEDILLIASSINNDDYLKKMVDNYLEHGFDNNCLCEIISFIDDDNYKIDILKKYNEYSFNSINLIKIIQSFHDSSYKSIVMDTLYDYGVFGNFSLDKNINLPNDMTFGIEIESEGKYFDLIKNDILVDGWKAKGDLTLRKGIEVVSPILRSNTGSEKDINRICTIMKSCSLGISDRCAGHIHIGASYFDDDVDSLKNFINLYSGIEKILYVISNDVGIIPRKNVVKYSRMLSPRIERALVSGQISFSDIDEVNDFANQIKKVQNSRYAGVNFKNFGRYYKNTIEFRIPNGTLNPKVWVENINLFGGMVAVSKEISEINRKDDLDVTDNEKMKLSYFNKIIDNSVSSVDKLSAFVNLVVPFDVDTYLKRYSVNSELISNVSYSSYMENEKLDDKMHKNKK